MAEISKGACTGCTRTDVSITATGGLRVHAANGKRTGPDNPACPGSGQKPKEAQAGPVRFLCRVPAGPGGCGHEVQLTANHRARSHLNGQDQPCGGGSDWPLAVGQPESLTSDTTGWDDEDWEAVLGRPEPSLGDVFAGEARNETIRPTEVVDLPHDRQPDPHRYEADVAIAEAERIQREQDAQYEESIRDGLEESRRRINDSVPLLNRTGPIQVCTCSTGSPSNYEGPAADCPVHGSEALTDPDTLMVRPDADPTLFDPTHVLSTELGPEVHPGEASACRLPGCCTHPQGFEYGDDGHGHSGSVCMFCGAQEPECCTHPDGRTYGGTDENGEDVWACEHCGEREDPAVTRMKAHGRARCTVADLDEGAFFVRHTAKAPLDKLVYRAGHPGSQGKGPYAVRTGAPVSRIATVTTPGPYLGRSGPLTNPTEEVTCTDPNGRPRPRRDRPASSGSDPAAAPTTSNEQPGSLSGPQTPSPQAATPKPDRSSKPGTSPTAPSTTARATAPSGKATTSGPSATASTPTRTASSTRTAPVADAFSTPKQAVNQSEKYDSYGRYKILHPDSSKKVNWTRATTFCKSIQDTYALSMWSQRMVLKGASVRSDLTAAAGTLEVKADKDRMNGLVDEAKKAAGDKIAANKGTAVHAYTEELDKIGLDKVSELKGVPDEFVPTVQAYAAILNDFGLEPVPLLTEFTTAVKQYEVAGTSDNCYRVTRDITVSLNGRPVTLYAGEYVISDKKGLALTERIPTPDGWTTMGEVQVGDKVFDAYGKIHRVTDKSRTKRIGTYIVRFDDRSSVTCDSEHIWWTSTGTRPGEPTAKGIKEIIGTLRNRWGSAQHRVPVAGPLDLPEVDLPIDPYLLGCWLGDGAVRGGLITKGRDLFEILETDGHVLGVEQPCHSDKCVSRTVQGLTTALKRGGLQYNKHIPAAYLRSSVPQRTALLRGLMDTDGCWNRARRDAVFTTTDKALAYQVEELLLSLGQRPNVATVSQKGFGLTVDCHRVTFTPVDLQPFRLPRKADQAAASVKRTTRSRRRVIVSVEPGPDVETACIGVDSPTRTYLCGDRMVPTHNTGADLSYGWQEIAIQLALYSQGLNTSGVWDWGTRTWGRPTDANGVQIQVRTDIGLVPHLPVDRSATGAPLATLYAVDLTAGWAAAVLCAQVRSWRKERKLATPLEVADVIGDRTVPVRVLPDPDENPSAPVSRPAPASRPVTLADKARAVTSRAEASAVYQEAVAARTPVAEVKALVQLMQDKLKSFTEQGA